MIKAELLSPAGSFEIMKACYKAGADAVYMGLPKFSARAYADNASLNDYIKAIDYAHLRNKKLYLTVNTLFKEDELLNELPEMLRPLYEAGLDAVIVQDIGAMKLIHTLFPDLPIHASTQATVVGPGAVPFFKALGVTRIVPARELSLKELKRIHDKTGIELECFIHGALCYAYSGQCLFSSIAGGRSGNRGRCAQPCRMQYEVYDENHSRITTTAKKLSGKSAVSEGYVLSLKDLNTLKFLPEILENGIFSLKIEGRMKPIEYAAGVTAIYRKYIDLYFEKGKEGYTVEKEDEERLFNLFNRQGFSDGYYKKHNSKDMLTLFAPEFLEKNTGYISEIRENIRHEEKRLITGTYKVKAGELPVIKLRAENSDREYTFIGKQLPEKAETRSLSAHEFNERMSKTGESPFAFTKLSGELDDGLFFPVSSINFFRREALEFLEEKLLFDYRREKVKEEESTEKLKLLKNSSEKEQSKEDSVFSVSALVSDKTQFDVLLGVPEIKTLYLESTVSEPSEYISYTTVCHDAGKKLFLAIPNIFRDRTESYLTERKDFIKNAGFDGYLIRSVEGADFVKNSLGEKEKALVTDTTLYTFNSVSKKTVSKSFNSKTTCPVELNFSELIRMDNSDSEIILYGYLPMMISANCINRTALSCDRIKKKLILKDRLGNEMTVLNDCRNCINTIYNSKALSLIDSYEKVRKLNVSGGRLNFTFESARETNKIAQSFIDTYIYKKDSSGLSKSQTRGHFMRGVE